MLFHALRIECLKSMIVISSIHQLWHSVVHVIVIKLSRVPQNNCNNELGSLFKLWETEKVMKELKTGKAPGPNGIRNEFLVHAGTPTITWLTSLFNVCLQENTKPKVRRRASVVAVLKPGNLIPQRRATG